MLYMTTRSNNVKINVTITANDTGGNTKYHQRQARAMIKAFYNELHDANGRTIGDVRVNTQWIGKGFPPNGFGFRPLVIWIQTIYEYHGPQRAVMCWMMVRLKNSASTNVTQQKQCKSSSEYGSGFDDNCFREAAYRHPIWDHARAPQCAIRATQCVIVALVIVGCVLQHIFCRLLHNLFCFCLHTCAFSS